MNGPQHNDRPSPGTGLPAEHDAERYDRQTMLPAFGAAGQRRLAEARVLVVGAGGLGAPVLTYLAAGGIGHLGIADADHVTTSNLARQVLYGPGDVGEAKVRCAARRLGELNPEVETVPFAVRVTQDNIGMILRDFDIVVDASDNLETRYLLNDTALAHGRTYVWGAVAEYSGRAGVVRPGRGPCFRCLFPHAPAPRSVIGVFGPICAVIGGWMAGEVLAIAAGIREPAVGALVEVDLRHGAAEVLATKGDKRCRNGCLS